MSGAANPQRSTRGPAEGIGLCLSGGGYRAMVFHVGALRRLNELGYLPKLDRVSSVSGGSITAARLAVRWNHLAFGPDGVAQRFQEEVEGPVRKMAATTIDRGAILAGLLVPGLTAAGQVAKAYRKHLLGDATLQDLPDSPRFVINASNLQSGALWRFSKPYMRDYRVGEVKFPRLAVADVVAASSAFPPFLSPMRLRLNPGDFTPGSGDLQQEPFTCEAILTDGGVYDNLGLETVYKRLGTVLISDGGQKMEAAASIRSNWYSQFRRVLDVVDNQVRSLRKRSVIDGFRRASAADPETPSGLGTYWGVRTDIAEYGLADSLPCTMEHTSMLAMTPTRLAAMDALTQERLVNWGYAVCDAAMRRYVDRSLPPPPGFPYPRSWFA